MATATKRTVFVSYASKSDKDWTQKLAQALASHGLLSSISESDAVSQEALQQTLEESLRASDAVGFVITGDISERANLFFELGFAKGLGKQAVFIVPGNHDTSWIPSGLRDEEIITRRSPAETAFALAASLRTRSALDQKIHGPSPMVQDLSRADRSVPRLPILLLLDTSGSMAGERIAELTKATEEFLRSLSQDEAAYARTDLAILTFGGAVRVDQFFAPLSEVKPIHLEASGMTPMGEALSLAIEMLDQLLSQYRRDGIAYFRPWIVLLTDGSPTDEWRDAAKGVRDGLQHQRFRFLAIGLDQADMETLSQITTREYPPLRLAASSSVEALFSWLSTSLRQGLDSAQDDVIPLPPASWLVAS